MLLNDKLIITGTILPVDPSLDDSNRVGVSGYALAGVLNDCSIPFDKYPAEYNNQTLEQISKTIAGFFGLSVFFTEPSGAAFDRTALGITDTPLNFLISLAKKKGFLISSRADGGMLFRKARTTITANKTTTLKEGHTPLLSVSPSINPQDFYSSITGVAPLTVGSQFESATINNPFLTDVLRPHIYEVDEELSGADLQKAVKWKMGLMFAEALKYQVSVQGWRDERGNIWETNTFINLTAPSVMINKETTFIVESVNFNRSDGDTAELSLALPESYSGKIPATLPWL